MNIAFKPLYIFTTLLTMSALVSGYAQNTDFVADELIYDTNQETVVVLGNVEISNSQGYFYVEKLTYDIETGRIKIDGGVKGVLATGEPIIGDFAILNQEDRLLIIEGARILLENEMQIAAQRVRLQDDITIGEHVVASTCHICRQDEEPLWKVSASQVYRDETAQKIYFKDARFSLLGLNLGFLPNFRIPDIGVDRMSGFLSPQFEFSNLSITGIRIPYYQTLGDHSDITITPYWTAAGAFNLENEFRWKIPGGELDVEAVYSISDGIGEYGRFMITPTLEMELWENWDFETQFQFSSDYDFSPYFGYTNPDKNYASLSYTSNNSHFLAELIDYRPKTEAGVLDDRIKVLPHIRWEYLRTAFENSQHKTLLDVLVLDKNGDEVTARLTAQTQYTFSDIYFDSLLTKLGVGAIGQYYHLRDNVNDSTDEARRFAPYVFADFSLPLSRSINSDYELITPRVQFVWSENSESGAEIPNNDSPFFENDYASLFSINRFSGLDRIEQGRRINLGVSYSRQLESGSKFEFGFGRVIRFDEDDNSSNLQDISTYSDDWVGYVDWQSNNEWSLYGRGTWNDNYELTRADAGIEYSSENLSYTLSGVHLSAEPLLGFNTPRSEINFEGEYRISDHWLTEVSWKHDLENQTLFETEIGLTYGNECIEVAGLFSRDFNRGEGIESETKLNVTVTLIGLGGTAKKDWPRRQCSNFGGI